MKKNIYYAIFFLLMFISFSEINAQTTEDFETEITGATTFSDNGQNFTVTNGPGETDYAVFDCSGCGWNGTGVDNKFLDNTPGVPPQNDDTSFTITSRLIVK